MTDITHTGHLRRSGLGGYEGQLIDRDGWVTLLTATLVHVDGQTMFALEGRTGPIPPHLHVAVLDDPPEAA